MVLCHCYRVGLNSVNSLTEKHINCPYCGESIEVLIDQQEVGQQYIEDCQVCCQPITFSISMSDSGHLLVAVHDENESF